MCVRWNNDLKFGTVVVLKSLSKPIDFGFKRSRVKVRVRVVACGSKIMPRNAEVRGCHTSIWLVFRGTVQRQTLYTTCHRRETEARSASGAGRPPLDDWTGSSESGASVATAWPQSVRSSPTGWTCRHTPGPWRGRRRADTRASSRGNFVNSTNTCAHVHTRTHTTRGYFSTCTCATASELFGVWYIGEARPEGPRAGDGVLGRGQLAPPHQLGDLRERCKLPQPLGFSCILSRQINFPGISVRVAYSLQFVLCFCRGIYISISPHINSWGVRSPAYPPSPAPDARAPGLARLIFFLYWFIRRRSHTTTIRLRFDRRSTSIRPRYDYSTTYVTTGLLHWGLNK